MLRMLILRTMAAMQQPAATSLRGVGATSSHIQLRVASIVATRRLSSTESAAAATNVQPTTRTVTKMYHGFEKVEQHIVLPKPVFQPIDSLPQELVRPSGWTPVLPASLTPASTLPFAFARSKNGNLPVYSRYRNGRTKLVTVLRKFAGDEQVLFDEVRRVVGKDFTVRRYAGRLEIDGDHTSTLQLWLRKLGF